MPTLVPELNLSDSSNATVVKPVSSTESLQFLVNFVQSLDMPDKTLRVQTSLLQTAKEHLNRLSEMDTTVAGTAKFTSLYIGAQLLMSQILEHKLWTNPTTLVAQQANTLRANIDDLLQNCLRLQHLFVGLSPAESCLVKQLRLKALALNLVHIVQGMNASALAPCHHFLSAVEDMQREIYGNNLEPDSFTAALFRELSVIEEPKPGTVSRILIPLLMEDKLGKIPEPNVSVSYLSLHQGFFIIIFDE